MAFAIDIYTASASQTDFTITFPYIEESHVVVYVDGALQTSGAGNDYTIVSSTIVRFNSGLTGGETVVIKRSTSRSTRLVDYATASTLTEEDLDNDSLQAFYMAQEAIDAYEGRLTPAVLTDGASIALDLSLSDNFIVTLGGNRTLANPTNATVGQRGSIVVVQDGTGSRTLAYGSSYKFAGGSAPTLTTAASAKDRLEYYVKSATEIHLTPSLNWS